MKPSFEVTIHLGAKTWQIYDALNHRQAAFKTGLRYDYFSLIEFKSK